MRDSQRGISKTNFQKPIRHSSFYLNPLEERFILSPKIADVSKERKRITPFGAISIHETLFEQRLRRFVDLENSFLRNFSNLFDG